MMIFKFNKATTVIGFILVNMLAVSCDCNDTPEEKDRKELVAEEKKLIKETLEPYKKIFNYNFTSEDEKEFIKSREEFFREIKEKSSLEDLNKTIKGFEAYIKILESGDNQEKQAILVIYQSLMELILSKLKKKDPSIPRNLQVNLNSDTLKQILVADLAVYNNLKQQLELKNKGKNLAIRNLQEKNR